MPLARSLVMEHEALYCSAAISVGIGIPHPPSLGGSAKTSFSASMMLVRPVIAGKSLNRKVSTGYNLPPRSGTTCIR